MADKGHGERKGGAEKHGHVKKEHRGDKKEAAGKHDEHRHGKREELQEVRRQNVGAVHESDGLRDRQRDAPKHERHEPIPGEAKPWVWKVKEVDAPHPKAHDQSAKSEKPIAEHLSKAAVQQRQGEHRKRHEHRKPAPKDEERRQRDLVSEHQKRHQANPRQQVGQAGGKGQAKQHSQGRRSDPTAVQQKSEAQRPHRRDPHIVEKQHVAERKRADDHREKGQNRISEPQHGAVFHPRAGKVVDENKRQGKKDKPKKQVPDKKGLLGIKGVPWKEGDAVLSDRASDVAVSPLEPTGNTGGDEASAVDMDLPMYDAFKTDSMYSPPGKDEI